MMMYYLCRNKILYHECYLLFENTYLSHIYHYFGGKIETYQNEIHLFVYLIVLHRNGGDKIKYYTPISPVGCEK